MPIHETPPAVENAVPAADAVYAVVEEAARECYVRALKVLPPDLKAALRRARDAETDATGRGLLDIMLENVGVAERDANLVCQDTGTVVFWLEVGEDCPLNLARGHGGGQDRAPSAPRSNTRCVPMPCTRSRARTP